MADTDRTVADHWHDARIPAGLRLSSRGSWPPPLGPRVTIVGARRPTSYGIAVAQRLAADLARAGVIVVSGLCPGIESAVHEGVLSAHGASVAVLSAGINVVAPPAVTTLAERIVAAGGALVTEIADEIAPRASSQARRAWVLAALAADVVVVVETEMGSSSLLVAEAAIAEPR